MANILFLIFAPFLTLMKNKKVISVLIVVVTMTLKGVNVIPAVFILPAKIIVSMYAHIFC